jgi:hypothetical protein
MQFIIHPVLEFVKMLGKVFRDAGYIPQEITDLGGEKINDAGDAQQRQYDRDEIGGDPGNLHLFQEISEREQQHRKQEGEIQGNDDISRDIYKRNQQQYDHKPNPKFYIVWKLVITRHCIAFKKKALPGFPERAMLNDDIFLSSKNHSADLRINFNSIAITAITSKIWISPPA